MTDRITLAQFQDLDRDTMVDTIRKRHPHLVKGKTRAKKDELLKLYRLSLLEELNTLCSHVEEETVGEEMELHSIGLQLEAGGKEYRFKTHAEAFTWLETMKSTQLRGPTAESIVIDEANFVPADDGKPKIILVGEDGSVDFNKVFTDEKVAIDAIMRRHHDATHVHGPGCGHHHEAPVVEMSDLMDFPTIAGTEDMQRVNPEMPIMPFQDGAVIAIPPAQQVQAGPDYVLKSTGEPGELDVKQKRLVDAFVTAFNKVMENPADSTSRREAKGYAYSLKVAGVIISQKFHIALDSQAKHVREARRNYKLTGIDNVKDAAAAVAKDTKTEEMIAEAGASA